MSPRTTTTARCQGTCKGVFPRASLMEVKLESGTVKHMCPQCAVEREENIKFKLDIEEFFGEAVKSLMPKIMTQRKRLHEQGYSDFIILSTLYYLKQTGFNMQVPSLAYVTQQRISKALQSNYRFESAAHNLSNALEEQKDIKTVVVRVDPKALAQREQNKRQQETDDNAFFDGCED